MLLVWLLDIFVIIIQNEISSLKSWQGLCRRTQDFIKNLCPCNILFFFPLVKMVNQKVLIRAFYAYLIHEREYGHDNITKDGSLYRPFLIDVFANVEEDKLDYIRAN